MENKYLSEICNPDSGTKTGVRKGCVQLLSIILPPLTMRKVDRVCGDVLRPELVVRTETEFELPSPAKVCPCAAVMHKSRFREKSAFESEGDASATQYVPSSEETTASALFLPPEKSDNRSDNMSRSVFTESKDTKNNYSSHFQSSPVICEIPKIPLSCFCISPLSLAFSNACRLLDLMVDGLIPQ